MTGNGPARPVDAAIVEDAADADVAMGIGVECLQQALAGRPGAVDDGTPRQAALRQTTPRQGRDGCAVADDQKEMRGVTRRTWANAAARRSAAGAITGE